MKNNLYFVPLLLILLPACFNKKTDTIDSDTYVFKNLDDVRSLMTIKESQIPTIIAQTMARFEADRQAIIDQPTSAYTFASTFGAYDRAVARIFRQIRLFESLSLVESSDSLRKALSEGVVVLKNKVSASQPLYSVLKKYMTEAASDEQLTKSQKYYMEEVIHALEQEGLHLDTEILDKLCRLSTEITALVERFEQTIAQDTRVLIVDPAALTGVDEIFIKSLEKTDDGKVVLGTDYPTVNQIIKYCTNSKIRKDLYLLFYNRGMPTNKDALEKLVQLRYQKANILGFKNFAELDIANQMAKSPTVVSQFLSDLFAKSSIKEAAEFALLKKNLPSGITLNEDGTLNPWDKLFVVEHYRKTFLDLDENLIKEYFPLEKTIEGLFSLYQNFFDVVFKQQLATGLWDDQLIFIQVFSKKNELLGSIVLDLFPREGKFPCACQTTIIPSVYDKVGTRIPAVVLVIANFSKPTADQPSLLTHREVKTFFHEFGHALHSIFGATNLFGQSGTQVKSDFIELPSQMLEQWLWDKQVLRDISSHYKTNEKLPDALIDRMIAAKNVFIGTQIDRQINMAVYSLELYSAMGDVDSDQLDKKIAGLYSPYETYIPEAHQQASFGHLVDDLYASKYYSYLWSEVFAADIFDTIKQHGLTNSEIGTKYRDTILAKGGSADPEELLVNFLGRKPTQDAFLRSLGLK